MGKKLAVLLFILSSLLAGCSNNTDMAVQYLEALNDRDLETARALVCEAREDDVAMGLTTVDDPDVEAFSFSNISCAARGADVTCRFVVEQATPGAPADGVQQTRQVIFDFENGKVCGFDEQVVQ